MKFYVCVLALFVPISLAHAESWPLKKGQYYTAQGVYSSLPISSTFTQPTNFTYSYTAISKDPPYNQFIAGDILPLQLRTKNTCLKAAYPFELEYGLYNDLTILTKIDLGYVHERLTVTLANQSSKLNDQFKLINDYYFLDGYFGFRKRLSQSPNKTISTSWVFFPGEYRTYKQSLNAVLPLAALEGKLSLGIKSPEFKFDNFIEWQFTTKYYFNQQHFQFGMNVQAGFKPYNRWQIVLGLKATSKELKFIKRNIPNLKLLFYDSSIFPRSASRNDIQKFLLTANELINPYRKSHLHFTSYQLDFKTSYFLNKKTSLGLEHFLLISKTKPSLNYTVMLKYEKYF